ncbi:MAG: DNA polymerase IV [bacterium]|nr:DNA polymerase IV [bacterium]
MQPRIILHLDMDAFFPAIEQRENPQFRALPVVVGADPQQGRGRGVVSSASYEARKYGIRSAMPVSEAWRLCPDAIFLPVQGDLYARVSENIMGILRSYALLVEQVSLDEAYLDVSFTGSYRKAAELAEKIRREILTKERLTASCGIGPNKMVAKMACEQAKPDGVMEVELKEAEGFLSSLDIRAIPGVGPKTEAVLESFFKRKGLKVSDVRKAAKGELTGLLGAFGAALYDRVRGIDRDPVAEEEEVKSVGREHTFFQDTRDGEVLFPAFRELVSDVARELEDEGFSFQTITVVCRFTGFEKHTKSKTFREPLQDWPLFEKEAMNLLLRFLVENLKPVRLVGVRAKVAPGGAERYTMYKK